MTDPKPCKKCGGLEKLKTGRCAICNRLWNEQNKEKIVEYGRKSRLANKEAISKRRKAKRDAAREANRELYLQKQRDARERNKEAVRKRAREWYANNRERALAWHKQKAWNLRLEMIQAYGGKCVCCGESHPRFLTIDHINGGGTKHRRDIGWSGSSVAKYLRRMGWPQDGYQLLCFNCNCGRAFNNGICPHKDVTIV